MKEGGRQEKVKDERTRHNPNILSARGTDMHAQCHSTAPSKGGLKLIPTAVNELGVSAREPCS